MTPVLTRIACFNVCTGDIEDAPGLDSLWSFSADVKDGKIVVSASEKEVQSKVGRIVSKARTEKPVQDKESVIIVGGGSGGIHCVESLRMVCPLHIFRLLGFCMIADGWG